ncbi:TRM11 family SAM-dependent methyltransferase [Saccharothrix luteola]|uniref:TRM11 family SAM-dependent methyltransferase n=1 Tax=Saccharothrix luteola TaxID=2893018 RepID=UPI001E40FAA5|nr:DNA methyltransferase [Saccharothrix luteola]MCC8244993.1 site-specific DNA-methyltransferase [Saccharothrix luteola]
MSAASHPDFSHPGPHREEGTSVTNDPDRRHAVADAADTADDNSTTLDTSPIPVDKAVDTTSGRGARDSRTDAPAVSVWTTAQTSPAAQRKNTYTAESTAHPAKMLPEVVRHAVAHYTKPGDLVLDPMCGIGTTLVEAVRLGRRAVGVEYEPHWVQVATANLDLAREQGIEHDARVFHGDARQLVTLLPDEYVGRAALVVTSPPYGPSTHGQVSVAPGAGVQKYHHLYGNTLDRGNLANIGHHRLLAGFTRILAALRTFLKPGGHIAITIRPWREHAELIDLPSQILACGRAAGLIPVERDVALLARAAETDLVARGSFFQRDFIRKQREAGLPLHLIAHEDVLVFRTALHKTAGGPTATTTDVGRLRPARSSVNRIADMGERRRAA